MERAVQPTIGGEDLGNKALPRVGSRGDDLRIRNGLRVRKEKICIHILDQTRTSKSCVCD